MTLLRRAGEAAKRRIPEGRHLDYNTEVLQPVPLDEAVVGKAVDGLGQVGAFTDRFVVACSETELERQFDGADSHFPAGLGDVSGEASRQQHGRRTDQRAVDDLEVLVQDREGRVTAPWERPEVEARCGPRSFPRGIAGVIRVLRGHEVPPEGRRSVGGPKSIARASPAGGTHRFRCSQSVRVRSQRPLP